jgi:hypothetical protein
MVVFHWSTGHHEEISVFLRQQDVIVSVNDPLQDEKGFKTMYDAMVYVKQEIRNKHIVYY